MLLFYGLIFKKSGEILLFFCLLELMMGQNSPSGLSVIPA